jgi:tetratricopeptide (TPR) repeat protein
MGSLTRFRFSPEFIERFPVFVETGTGKGVSLSYAVDCGFKTADSIEYDKRLCEAARKRFVGEKYDHVRIWHGNSAELLKTLLSRLPSREGVCFWLDAHFPGSDYFGEAYDSVADQSLRTPLRDELEAISAARSDRNYCIIVDDLRVYEDGDYEHGNLPSSHKARTGSPLKAGPWIWRDGHDAGYAIIAPLGAPRPEIIQKHSIGELVDIARRYVECGDMISARVEYHKVLEVTQPFSPPDVGLKKVARGEACRYMAAIALAESRDGAACDWFLEAAACDPLATEYRIDLIYKVLLPMRSLDMAKTQAEMITRIDPESARGWRALASVEKEFGDAEGMRAAVEKAKQLEPDDPDTLRISAILESDTGNQEKACGLYLKLAYDHPPWRGKALLGYSIAESRAGHHQVALEAIDEALKAGVGDDEALAIWNRAEIMLTLGMYKEGWRDQIKRFDLERKIPGVGPAGNRFLRPMFDLEEFASDPKPCRVHVHGEQGFGDVICMARYLPMLADMCADIRFEVDDKLLGIFNLSGVRIVRRALDYPGSLGLEDFDYHVPAMCLPAIFGTDIDDIPWDGPYVGNWKPHEGCNGKKVGLVWKAGARPGLWHQEYAKRKSVDFSFFKPLFGTRWDRPDILIKAINPEGWTFAETVEEFEDLDLLITVDTAAAHLAGAMGMPTWLLMHTGGSWHWMAPEADGGRWKEKSPWYPSVRIFRQDRPHEWSGVISRVAGELRNGGIQANAA